MKRSDHFVPFHIYLEEYKERKKVPKEGNICFLSNKFINHNLIISGAYNTHLLYLRNIFKWFKINLWLLI